MSNPRSFGKRHLRTPAAAKAAPVIVSRPREQWHLPTPQASAKAQWPFLTLALVAILSTVFALQQRYAHDHLTLAALTAEGALSRQLVFGHGQWWRILTGPALHSGVPHLLGNMIALAFAGSRLEPIMGRGWMMATYVVSGLAGAFTSMAMSPVISVGASGAIMGLIAVMFMISFHDDVHGAQRKRLRIYSLMTMVPSIVPSMAGAHTDIAAHVGGALAGTAMGALLLVLWHDEHRQPPHANAAAALGLAGILLTAFGFSFAGTASARIVLPVLQLIPTHAMPESMPAAIEKSADLVERYPDDPRAQLFRGVYFLMHHDAADAEPHLQSAAKALDATPGIFPDIFHDRVQATLAVTQLLQGRIDAAQKTGRTTCGSSSSDPLIAKMRQILRDGGACR